MTACFTPQSSCVSCKESSRASWRSSSSDSSCPMPVRPYACMVRGGGGPTLGGAPPCTSLGPSRLWARASSVEIIHSVHLACIRRLRNRRSHFRLRRVGGGDPPPLRCSGEHRDLALLELLEALEVARLWLLLRRRACGAFGFRRLLLAVVARGHVGPHRGRARSHGGIPSCTTPLILRADVHAMQEEFDALAPGEARCLTDVLPGSRAQDAAPFAFRSRRLVTLLDALLLQLGWHGEGP